MGNGRKKPAQIPMNVTSKRPIALMPTTMHWWEASRPPEVRNVSGNIGLVGMLQMDETERTIWEILMEMDSFKHQAGRNFEKQLPWTWLRLPSESASVSSVGQQRASASQRIYCGCHKGTYFEHQRRTEFEGCVAEPFQTITANLPGSKWSCLLPHVALN